MIVVVKKSVDTNVCNSSEKLSITKATSPTSKQ